MQGPQTQQLEAPVEKEIEGDKERQRQSVTLNIPIHQFFLSKFTYPLTLIVSNGPELNFKLYIMGEFSTFSPTLSFSFNSPPTIPPSPPMTLVFG